MREQQDHAFKAFTEVLYRLIVNVSAMLVYIHQKNIAQVFILERYFFDVYILASRIRLPVTTVTVTPRAFSPPYGEPFLKTEIKRLILKQFNPSATQMKQILNTFARVKHVTIINDEKD